MEELKIRSAELQAKVDRFKKAAEKPADHWRNVRELIEINFQIIRIKYHG